MAGFRPSQVVIGHRRRARQGVHDDPQPGAQEARPADHRGRAPASSSTTSSARRCARRSARSPGRPGCRNVDVRLVHAADHRRLDRRLRPDQPGRVPGPPHQDRDLQRVRAARPPRGAAERRQPARPGAARDRRRAVRRRPRPRARTRSASRGRCSSTSAAGRRTSRSCARAGSRGRGCSPSAGGRSRRASPTGSTCRSRGPRRSRSTTRGASRWTAATRSRAIVSDDVEVWAAGVELVMEELGGGDLLPGRIYLCGGGSRLPEIRGGARRRAVLEAAAVRPAARGRGDGPGPDRDDHRRDGAARRPAGRDAARASRTRRSSSSRPRTRSTRRCAASCGR